MLNDQNNGVMDQSIPAAPSAPPGYCRAFARLVSPGAGAFANFVLLGGRAFANPAAIPELLTHTWFLSEYNYTEDFTGKENRLAQRPCKGMFLILCMHFFIAYQARIT